MKKLLIGFALLSAVVALGQPGLVPRQQEFLSTQPSWGFVYLTNNSTIVYNETNVLYINGSGQQVQGLGTNYINPTFIQTGVTNGPTNLNFQVYAEFPYSGVTVYYTNTTYTNTQFFPRAWNNLFNYVQSDGAPGSNTVYVTAALDSDASTNALTVWLAKGVDDGKFDYYGNNTMSFIFPISGMTNTTFYTNMPSMFNAGARKFQLWKITAANSTTNAVVYLKGVRIVSP